MPARLRSMATIRSCRSRWAIGDRVDTGLDLCRDQARRRADVRRPTAHLFGHALDGLRFFHRLWTLGPARHVGLPVHPRDPRRQSRSRSSTAAKMQRDFTYIDDIVAGVIAASTARRCPRPGDLPHRIYNLGNHRAVALMDFIATIEKACGRKAKIDFQPMQPGDVKDDLCRISSYDPGSGLSAGDGHRGRHSQLRRLVSRLLRRIEPLQQARRSVPGSCGGGSSARPSAWRSRW